MLSVRSASSAVAVLLSLTATPLAAQSVEGAALLPGVRSVPIASLSFAPGHPAGLDVADAPTPAGPRIAPGAEVAERVVVSAPQVQEGGFPWLHVGIGAGVAALFISAVVTANSGDAAELPRGGISVVLPGT